MPEKEMSIARAAWRIDGMSSLQAGEAQGVIETALFVPEGNNLSVNVDCFKGNLSVEVLDSNKKIIKGYNKNDCLNFNADSVKQSVRWNKQATLPSGKPICLRFYLEKGDLYSYAIE